MKEVLIVGQRTLGLPFREQLTIREDGMSHHGEIASWNDVRRVKITHFKGTEKDWSRWWFRYAYKRVQWDKMTIETKRWKIVLDSRVIVRPDDSIKDALGIIGVGETTNINPAFTEVRNILERFCPDKIDYKSAFSGSFDFSEWTSWVGAFLVILLIVFLLTLFCFALRPLFR